jgi:hypothetical protein
LASEILIALLYPGGMVFENGELLAMFKRFSTSQYLDLLDVLVHRLSNANYQTLIHLDLLQYFLVVLFNINFIRMLCDLHVSAINYLIPIQKRLRAVVEPNVSILRLCL